MASVNPGSFVAERYRLIREIGLGGMGTVWLAHDIVLDSRCALKLISAGQAQQEEFRIRFEWEAKCAAQLRSVHVVDVLNRGEWHGQPFIVMEFLEGEDLAARLKRVGRLSASQVYPIIAQVARALTRAQALGIVHRDIKPGNIFLVPGDDHEVAKLLDFGVAQHKDFPNAFGSAVSAQFIGTPCYMSPEQARSAAVDWRSDLWSLAVITFECLTGDVPFPQESMPELVEAITRGPLPKLTASRPDLPPALEVWWKRAMARDPRWRFQSASEFADSLADAIGISRRLVVAGFPQPTAAATTASDAGRDGHETDAAVTLYTEPSAGHLQRRRRAPAYLIAGAALLAALASVTLAWRPINQASGVSVSQKAAALVVPAVSAALPAPTPPPVTPGPKVLVVDSGTTPALQAGAASVKVPVVPVRKPRPGRQRVPRAEKDYGI
jgi:predicted Ser/Thr protein kinase